MGDSELEAVAGEVAVEAIGLAPVEFEADKADERMAVCAVGVVDAALHALEAIGATASADTVRAGGPGLAGFLEELAKLGRASDDYRQRQAAEACQLAADVINASTADDETQEKRHNYVLAWTGQAHDLAIKATPKDDRAAAKVLLEEKLADLSVRVADVGKAK